MRVASVSTETWLVGGLVALAALLRFATLDAQSYWFDEAQAAHELHLSLGSMLSSMATHETNPPLYFVLGWVWVHVFGNGAFALRSISALAGCAAVALAYLCGRELVSVRAGLVAAALVAVSPFMIWYSQEAREYMLLAACSGASLLYFARSLREPSRRNISLWGLFSALAILTHSFAGFLVAPEALWLIYAVRTRAVVVAAALIAAVQVALLPLLFSHATSSLLGFISSTSLSGRIQQVPVAFGLGTLYESPMVHYGLLGAAALAAAVIALLVIGADSKQLRGAGIAAALAGCVLLVPLVLALLGEDYYISRALMPAWIPLAVVIGAACTAPRVRIAGAVLTAVLIASFVYAQVRISGDAQYQRPDWHGVARALGPPPPGTAARAIVAYDGELATDPLAIYVPGVPWDLHSSARTTFGEIDVVGHTWQTIANRLPSGVHLIASKVVGDFLVARFALEPAKRITPAQVDSTAPALLSPGPSAAPVLVQIPRAAG